MDKDIVIFDIDGTIANIDHRLHYITGETPDWDKFYAECVKDTPINDIVQIAQTFMRLGYEIVFMTGRTEAIRQETYDWLKKHLGAVFGNCALYMRNNGDHRPDAELKKEIFTAEFSKKKNKVLCVLEDRASVVDMWRELGLTCLQVAKGDF